MDHLVAFCSRFSQREEQKWLEELSTLMLNANIIPFYKLTTEQKKKVQVAIVANPNKEELAELENLRWVQSLWSGIENVLEATAGRDVEVVRMVDPVLSDTMAEAVLAWTFYLHRDMPQYQLQQRNKEWKQHPLITPCERKIGLLGLGALGKASAQKLLENGFSVRGWSRRPSDLKGVPCYHGEEGLVRLLKKTNILICLLPLTDETRGLLNKETLSILPESASLINFSRGQIINEEDLLYCLNHHHLKHAVLDVFAQEPLPQNHPFWELSNITILPHISAPTNKQSASRIVASNILSYLKTGIIPDAVERKLGY